MPVRRLALALCPLLSFVLGCGASGHAEFKKQSFDYDGRSRNYCIYVPKDYQPGRPTPAILFLHGRFEGGNNGTGATKVGLGPAIRSHPERFDSIVIFAQTSESWRDDDQLPLAIATLEDAARRYAVDRNRVTLTGLSTGGAAVWKLGARYPGYFQALMPMCAFSSDEDVPNLTTYPVWAFHNRFDPFVGVWNTSGMCAKINTAGGHAKHTVYAAFGHDCWGEAYGDKEVVAWMQNPRNPGQRFEAK